MEVDAGENRVELLCCYWLLPAFAPLAFNLRQDALFKRQIDDPAICKRFQDKGLPDYFLVSVMLVSRRWGAERIG